MTFSLPLLPYDKHALEPYISAQTLEVHHGAHHATYVDNINHLLDGRPEANQTLEQVIKTSSGPVFDNAAQAYNHAFYWRCMKADGGGKPTGALAAAIDRDFGSCDDLLAELAEAATTHFGAGWAWLAAERSGRLVVTTTANADLPLTHGLRALLTIDVWEHAYYLDYRHQRAKYVEGFLKHLVDWGFALENFTSGAVAPQRATRRAGARKGPGNVEFPLTNLPDTG